MEGIEEMEEKKGGGKLTPNRYVEVARGAQRGHHANQRYNLKRALKLVKLGLVRIPDGCVMQRACARSDRAGSDVMRVHHVDLNDARAEGRKGGRTDG
jgi:hypothetical protein